MRHLFLRAEFADFDAAFSSGSVPSITPTDGEPVMTAQDSLAALRAVAGRTNSEVAEIIRVAEVKRRAGKSRTQIWRDVKAGLFPAPVKIGPNAIGWFAAEVDEWCRSRQRVHYAPQQANAPRAA